MTSTEVEIKGVIVPIVTPMHDDESINFAELDNQIERQIEAGIYGIFALGTNGEAYALTFDEKRRVLEAVIKRVDGRVPVYAGTGCVTTKETIETSKMAEALGADVLSIVEPYYAKASQDELRTHYETVAESVELPIVLYNIPARTGNALEPTTVAELAHMRNIVGAKDSSGDWDNLKAYIDLTRDQVFSVLSGNDALILRGLEAGASGAIAGCANVYPRNMVGIYESWAAGNLEEAERCQEAIKPLRACFAYGNPNTIVKTAMSIQGHPVGMLRAPFNRLSDEGVEALKRAVAACDAQGMS